MEINPARLQSHIDNELKCISDQRVIDQVRKYLLPHAELQLRDWNYGYAGEQFPCWTVLKHPTSRTEIAYCAQGFGPAFPWGNLNQLGNEDDSMDMDTEWSFTFLDAFFDSSAAAELPIWRIFKGHPGAVDYTAVSEEGEKAVRWNEVKKLRAETSDDYTIDTSIAYPRGW
jgi:hypothetical protein